MVVRLRTLVAFALLVTVVPLILLIGGDAGASCAFPTVEVDPPLGPGGTTVTVTGEYWSECNDTPSPGDPPPAEVKVRVGVGEEGAVPDFGPEFVVKDDGTFRTTVTIPADAADGFLAITAEATEGIEATAFEEFEVRDSRAGARIAGITRIDTSVEVSKRAFPDGSDTAYLASDRVPFDAQVGATLGDGPILLVNPCGTIDDSVLLELDRLGAKRVDVLGGFGAVSDLVHEQALTGRFADDGNRECPGGLPASADGLTLTATSADGRIIVRLQNGRAGAIEVGRAYQFEQRFGVAFSQINEEAVFSAEAIVVEPGDSFVVVDIDPDNAPASADFLRDLDPGTTYRVRFQVGSTELGVEFPGA